MKLWGRWESIFMAFICAILLLFFYFFIGGAWCNDIKASHIEKEYAKMELPEKTECVETASYVGNVAGTSNSTEIWVGMLIHSELSLQEIESYLDGYLIQELPDDLADAEETVGPNLFYPWHYDDYKSEFAALREMDSGKGYFIIGRYHEAFTQQDLRGH